MKSSLKISFEFNFVINVMNITKRVITPNEYNRVWGDLTYVEHLKYTYKLLACPILIGKRMLFPISFTLSVFIVTPTAIKQKMSATCET